MPRPESDLPMRFPLHCPAPLVPQTPSKKDRNRFRLRSVDRTLYDLLHISPSATSFDVFAAYRNLVSRVRDKTHKSEQAKSRYWSLCLAYEVLSDSILRREYDTKGLRALEGKHAALLDLLEVDFDGNRVKSSGRGQDAKVLVRVELEDAARGSEQSIDICVKSVCKKCMGEGSILETVVPCVVCKGSGWVPVSRYESSGRGIHKGACPSCGGTGKQYRVLCEVCGGEGMSHLKKTIRVKIPRGVESGSLLKVNGYGGVTEVGGKPGDLYVGIIVRSHPSFSREGNDVYSDVDVPVPVALLGGSVIVATLWGLDVLEVPQGTQHEDVLTLARKGFKVDGNGVMGAHHFKVLLKVPTNLSMEERNLVEKLRSLEE